jgi:hypothetical protein
MKKLALIGLFLCLVTTVFTQEIEPKDTTKHHSVKLATILSTFVPGAGQVYNHFAMPKGQKKAFWKVPIIYAGLGASGYFLLQNNSLKNELKTEYKTREKGLLGLDKYQTYDNQAILSLYNQHLNRRDLFIVGFSILYILQIVEAAVEAHFVEFDISEDLSLKIEPVLYNYHQAGIKLCLNFVK